MKELCDEVVSLQSQLDECQLMPADDLDDHAPSVSSNSYHLAKHLHGEIKKAENNTWKTVDEDEMGISYADAASRVPVDLYSHVAWLITDSDEVSFYEDSAQQRDELMNLYSGQILAATNLSDAKLLGLEALAVAMESSAEKIISPKIETFATQIKHSKKRQDNVKQVMSEESAVTRALCFTQDLSDEARIEAFSYEWLDYPPSLFDKLDKNQFAMRKGCKASYLKALQDEIPELWEPSKELPMCFKYSVPCRCNSIHSVLQHAWSKDIWPASEDV